MRYRVAPFAAALFLLSTPGHAREWQEDWLIEDGFRIDVAAEGFDMPSALAVVPTPGEEPDAPAFFVTELRGKVKVVTRSGAVRVFAELGDDGFEFKPNRELPSGQGQGGMAGLCLDPATGYVFVTFLYRDDAGKLKNNMIRYETVPGTFAAEPSNRKTYTELFAAGESGLAHQIGPCQVGGDTMFVSIGEAWQSFRTTDVDQPYGKILRMTLDGDALEDNPHFQAGSTTIRNYVWAYGLSNPFGLKLLGSRLFTADNGLALDRFLEVERGRNYLWNGDDRSIATNAQFVWSPSVGPVQLDHYPDEAEFFPPEYRGSFFVACSGEPAQNKQAGLYRIPYDMEAGRLSNMPEQFVGPDWQMAAGLAFDAQGLLFSALFPDTSGEGRVYRITHDAERPHAYALKTNLSGRDLVTTKGCVGCHSIDGDELRGGAGPPLTRGQRLVDQILGRIGGDAYGRAIALLESSPNPSGQRRSAQRGSRRDGQGARGALALSLLEATGVRQALQAGDAQPAADRRGNGAHRELPA